MAIRIFQDKREDNRIRLILYFYIFTLIALLHPFIFFAYRLGDRLKLSFSDFGIVIFCSLIFSLSWIYIYVYLFWGSYFWNRDDKTVFRSDKLRLTGSIVGYSTSITFFSWAFILGQLSHYSTSEEVYIFSSRSWAMVEYILLYMFMAIVCNPIATFIGDFVSVLTSNMLSNIDNSRRDTVIFVLTYILIIGVIGLFILVYVYYLSGYY